MNASPIVGRELRVQARNRSNHWLRVCAALVVSLVFLALMLTARRQSATLGIQLFVALHTTLLAGIWVFGPVLTADCISSEKREGTLGLLFLTPLTALSVLLGKSSIHMWRAFALWLASIPVMTIPFVLGGITWLDVLSAATLEFCSVLMVLAAGLLSSAANQRAARAFFMAEMVGLILALFLTLVLGMSFFPWMPPGIPPSVGLFIGTAAGLATGLLGFSGWDQLVGMAAGRTALNLWLMALTTCLLASVTVFLLSLVLSAWLVHRNWRGATPSARAIRWRRIWFTPRFRAAAFRRAMQAKLDRNAVAWLQEHSVGGRLAKWTLCGVVLILEILLSWGDADWRRGQFQVQIAAFLFLGMAFVSARSFRRERENGVWELLLVSPLRAGEIAGGQIWGVWRQFFPAFAALLVLFLMFEGWDSIVVFWMLVSTFAVMPFVGVYLSLRITSFVVAWMATFAFAVLWPTMLPSLVMQAVQYLQDEYGFPYGWILVGNSQKAVPTLFWVAQLSVAVPFGILLYRGLTRRGLGIPSSGSASAACLPPPNLQPCLR
jgi:hypothetical protein